MKTEQWFKDPRALPGRDASSRVPRWPGLGTRSTRSSRSSGDNLGEELVAGRQWIDRAIVPADAVMIGLIVVGFTESSEAAADVFGRVAKAGPVCRVWPRR